VANVSRITHRDPRSVAGGVVVAKAAQLLATEPAADPVSFCPALAEVARAYSPEFAGWLERLPALVREPPESALPTIAWAGMPAPEFDAPIITPFVIPTVLAALWCLFRDPGSWPGAVAAVIRLGGDVDTLGAIVGALAGVRFGVGAIPAHLRDRVQQARELEALAVRYHALVERGM
jgi:ADP-ribosyl-[dinitrogen reductase] hydrolase